MKLRLALANGAAARKVELAGVEPFRCPMKFMVELRLKVGRNKAFEMFEARGPSRHPGVIFRGAWIGTDSDLAFVLVESADEALVAQAAESWSEPGESRITRVLDIEHF